MDRIDYEKKFGKVKRWSFKSINELADSLGVEKGICNYSVIPLNTNWEVIECTLIANGKIVYHHSYYATLNEVAEYLLKKYLERKKG